MLYELYNKWIKWKTPSKEIREGKKKRWNPNKTPHLKNVKQQWGVLIGENMKPKPTVVQNKLCKEMGEKLGTTPNSEEVFLVATIIWRKIVAAWTLWKATNTLCL